MGVFSVQEYCICFMYPPGPVRKWPWSLSLPVSLQYPVTAKNFGSPASPLRSVSAALADREEATAAAQRAEAPMPGAVPRGPQPHG
mmetsp:Transcript_102131/g.266532  ORF Transcript_102131/g.266532 Transcript_102131/m.266532 type:complete len:86 (-) Transcript_102131:54-311(-)